ncbi:MAG: hypothetical protein V7K26_05165 [Nostoc sp.]|uniref:pPIWI_RE_Z domain-containing protein n=1 Tax=Nostoc sp. TaxID=1180 RepID=UPI002FF25096
MRDTISWRKDLCKKLRNSDELQQHIVFSLVNADTKVQQRELKRLAHLIADVELGLTLLKEVAPEEPATSVEALLKGYRFPVEQLQSDRNWQLIQNARFYLIKRKGRQWLRVLQEYINLPEIIRIYSLEEARNVPQPIPSSTYPTRLEKIYLPTLLKTPQHRQRKVKLAGEGRWYAKISQKGNSPVEVPIDIPKEVANIAPSSVVALHRTRTKQNPQCSVTREELILAAQEMDDKLSQFGQQENYRNRLENILFQLYDAESDNFHQDNQLSFEGLMHIVGLLNVGKSTLLEILIYFFAKQGDRCGLMVNDVATAVRLASLFCHKLGIPAAPVLGSKRQEQLAKVYEPILKSEGKEITKGGMHPAWRWFSPVCPLLGLVQSEDKWEFGNEPCHKLYQKVPVADNDDSDDEDWQESDEKYTCPFYYKCPRHHLEHDIATASVWIFTPASFIHTRVPRQGFEQDLTFAEAVYRECKYLFVDEADRVQIQFDEEFAPDEVLVDASGNSFLNKLGLNSATIYNSDRSDMAGDRFVAWTSAHYHTQNATNRIYHLLLTHSKLVVWLGPLPFTGRSLFARIIRDLVDPPEITVSAKPKLTRQQIMEERRKRIIEADLAPTEQRRRRKQMMDQLDGFLQHPLNPRRGGELSGLALTILTAEDDRQALAEIAPWCKRWIEIHNLSLPDETQFEELTRNLQFAILVTILDNRLGFIVDNLSDLGRVINLHDSSQDLLHRPPDDFLPVLPESPVGNILGFLYKQERSAKKAGKLDYFRYVGVGRALLLNFPKLFAVDDWDGPHTVLISGTSYAPGSPAYHINIKPTVLLQPRTGEAGIAESQFFFSPKQNPQANYIALSGLPPATRKLAAKEMVEAMCYSVRGGESFLDGVFQDLAQRKQQQPEWWSDRDRILIVVGSYDESEWVTSILQSRCRFDVNINDDGIATLRRDNAPTHLHGILRSEIRNLQHLPTQIVVAPLMALERGHNILNAQGKAAFGAVLFLNRPMPVPDNWQSTVQQLNAWALKYEKDFTLYEEAQSISGNLTLTQVADIFYQNAVAEMVNLNYTAWAFKQLTQGERSVLCWTQLVSIWQIIGRLVRGGVPAVVHFIDVKFAPNSAIGEQDSESTSLLVAIIKVLEPYVEGEDVLARSLYGAFLNALKQMRERNLNYD